MASVTVREVWIEEGDSNLLWARTLGARNNVEGVVRGSGNRVSIDVGQTRAVTQVSETYSTTSTALFSGEMPPSSSANNVSLSVTGNLNEALMIVGGNGNTAAAVQTGNRNSAVMGVLGSGNDVRLTQAGNEVGSMVVRGNNNIVRMDQTGSSAIKPGLAVEGSNMNVSASYNSSGPTLSVSGPGNVTVSGAHLLPQN